MKKILVLFFLLFVALIFMFGYQRKNYLDSSNFEIDLDSSLSLTTAFKDATNNYFVGLSDTFKTFTNMKKSIKNIACK